MQRISEWMHFASNGWTALITLAIFISFIVWVLPSQAVEAEKITAGAGSPDSSFYYSAEELYAMAESYGQEGRQAYIQSRFTFDVIWPLVYTLFLGTWFSWVFGKLHAPGSLWHRTNVVPILGGIFDLLENVSASIVMARYPQSTPILERLATVFTMLKWIFVRGSFVIFLAGVLIVLFIWINAQRKPKHHAL